MRKKYVVLIFQSLAPIVSSQEKSSFENSVLAGLPPCALQCIDTTVPSSQCVPLTNQTCLCENNPVKEAIGNCISHNCTVTDALVATNITRSACDYPVRNRTHLFFVFFGTLIGICAFVVAQRLGYKLLAKLPLGPDDWLAFGAMALLLASYLVGIFGSEPNGNGRDIWTLHPNNVYKLFKFFYVQTLIYIVIFLQIKLSLLFFYLHIFSSHSGTRVRWIIWATILFNILFNIAFIILNIFQCSPISFYWTEWDGKHKGKCINISASAWAYAAIQIAISFWLMAIPLWLVRSLNLTWRKKLGVSLMFIVGAFDIVFSFARFTALVKFSQHSKNPSWDISTVSLWSGLELNVGVICICMPSIRVAIVRMWPYIASRASFSRYRITRSGTTTKYSTEDSSSNMRALDHRQTSYPRGDLARSEAEASHWF